MLTLHLIMKKAGNILLENNNNDKQGERDKKRPGEAGGETEL